MADEPVTDDQLAQLMGLAQEGDTAAYTRLLEAIVPRVQRSVGRQRHFAGSQEVEDLVQDVLLSIHAARATYDPSRPFGPWLAAIVRHRLVDGARRHTRRSHEVAVDDVDVTFADPAANPSLEAYGDPEALARAIRDLPPAQRDAIEMLKLREMSLKEAADATGSSIGALKVATHRAMTALRRALTKDHAEHG